MERLNFEYIKLDDLTPYENNAKRHAEEDISAIKSSINAFGMNDPIGVWGKKNIIVEGHGRFIALRELGYTEAPCIRLDKLTDEQRRGYALAHNKTAELAGWDFAKLEEELAAIDMDMSVFGFDMLEFEEEKKVVEDEVPEVDEESEPITKLGDVWQLGRHRLMCGDSTNRDLVATLMSGAKADLLLTDPPYNVNYEGATCDKLKIANDNMSSEVFREFLTDAFAAADSAVRSGGAFYIWHADSEGLNFRAACESVGWKVRQCLIWNKNSLVLGRQDYQWKHEPCLYGWKDGASHYFVCDRTQTTVIDCDKPQRNGEHPTMKPVTLFAKLIENSTINGDIVLDTFGGSGTTLIAAEQTGRTAYTMELDPKYCDVIIKRWEAFSGQKAELLNR